MTIAGPIARSEGAFDLIISDCDGVLIDSEVVAEAVLTRHLKSQLPDFDVAAMLSGKHGMMTEALLRMIAEETGWVMTADFRKALFQDVHHSVAREAPMIAGVDKAYRALTLPLAVASNSQRPHIEHAAALTGLTDLFKDRLFSASQAARAKPHPDLYLLVAETHGVSPARCLVIEDSTTGATAGLAAGMTVIGFTGASHLQPGHEDQLRRMGVEHVIDHMRHLPILVETLRFGAPPPYP